MTAPAPSPYEQEPTTCEITWCEHLAGYGPRNGRCRCHGPLVDELGPGSPDCPDAPAVTPEERYGHDCEHTSMQHGADGCNVPGCPCAFMSWEGA